MNLTKWLRWMRFIPVKLHLVFPFAFAVLGAYVGGKNLQDFWNIYVAGGFFLGILLGIPLQVLKHLAYESVKREKVHLPELEPHPGSLP